MAIENSVRDDDIDAQWQRANTLATRGEFAPALALYREIAASRPQLSAVWLNIGVALSRLGEADEALHALHTAAALEPDSPTLQLHLGQMLQQAGRSGEALWHYRRATEIDAELQVAWRYLGCALIEGGEVAAGEGCLLRAHAADPDEPECNFHLGSHYLGTGRYERAVEHLRAALRADPKPAVANNLAAAHYHLGLFAEALRVLEACLAEHPAFALAWNLKGGVMTALGRHAEARDDFGRAVAVDPEFLAARQNLARSRATLGDLSGAKADYAALMDQLPGDASIRTDFAHVLATSGALEEAAQMQQAGLELAPDSVSGWLTLASIREQQCQWRAALDAAMQALERDITVTRAHILAASALAHMGQLGLARERLERATELAGDDVQALDAIVGVYESVKDAGSALALFRRALQLQPGDAVARARLFDLTLSTCDWSEHEELSRLQVAQLEADLADPDGHLSFDVFNLQALPIGYELIARAAARASARIAVEAQRAGAAAPFVHAERQRERIRIGYALAYTWTHSLPLVLKELVARHDRARFEIYGYSVRPCNGSEFSRAYRAAFDRFRDLPSAGPRDAAAQIHADGIDVLVDVTGLTSINCMAISSFRPAPVQMHAFGYSITTGADFIDYLITDHTYLPPDWAALGPEQPVYLPHSSMPTWRPPVAAHTPTRADCQLLPDGIVFCNFNHPCKFEPSIFDVWMRILARVPGSVMWFGSWLHDTADNLRHEAAVRGVDGERLKFAPLARPEEHLARLSLADLALDNRYHGGGVTTVDALWAGVPVLTVLGETPAARLGATLVRAAGMPELELPDIAAYEERAVALARDPAALQALRERLRQQRESCPLFDAAGYARHMDAALAAAWDNYRAGRPPQRIEITPDGEARFG